MRHRLLAAGLGLAVLLPAYAAPTPDSGLRQLRQEIDALRKDYDQRLKNLEARLREAERNAAAQADANAQGAGTSTAPPPAPPPTRRTASASAFNPALGVILMGSYARYAHAPDTAIPGFLAAPGSSPGKRGFSLAESELDFSANVDPWFYGNLTLALDPDGGVDVEEGYFQTLALPTGLVVRGGRFFSAIGYLNDKHAHAWDFVDQPLPYRAMLGDQYGDDGVRLSWVAPTDRFVELGGELFRGGRFPAAGATHGGIGARSAYLHVGDDLGISNSWLAGLSWLDTDARDRLSGTDSFSGNSQLWIADLVWKWAPNGNPTVHNLQVQTEYFFRQEDGLFNAAAYSGTQRGWYVQGVYQFMPRWRVGLRYDELSASNASGPLLGSALDQAGFTPRRESVMVDYSNSEFSRLRLQFNRDHSQPRVNHELILQYIMSLGAHGAHAY